MLHNFTLWIRLSIADLFHTSLSLQRAELIAASPYYFETISRFRNLVDTAICGSIINEVSYKVTAATGIKVKSVDVYVDSMTV